MFPVESDYVHWIAVAKRVLSELQGVVSVVHFGQVKCPGVSDLDLWVVFDETLDGRKLEAKFDELERLSPIRLDFRPVPRELTAWIHFLLPIDSIEEISQWKPVVPDALQRQHLAYSFIFMWLPLKIAVIFRAMEAGGLSANMLRMLYSLRYSFKQFVALEALEAAEEEAFSLSVAELREAFVKGTADRRQFLELCKDCAEISSRGLAQVRPLGGMENDALVQLLPMHWLTLVSLGDSGHESLSVQMGPRWLFKRTPSLFPVRVRLDSHWKMLLGQYRANLLLRPYLCESRLNLEQSPVRLVPTFQMQAELMARFTDLMRRQGLTRRSIVSPLIPRGHRWAVAAFGEITRALAVGAPFSIPPLR